MKTVASVWVMLAALALPTMAAELNPAVKPLVTDAKPIDVKDSNVKESSNKANPFTGDTAAIENSVIELRLVKQRRAIAEQRLGEQKAITEIEKMKREAVGNTQTANLNVVPKVGGLPPNQTNKGSTFPSLPTRRLTAPALLLPATTQESAGPTLIGISEMGGRQYAIFETNGKAVSVPEGSQLNGITVGAIKGRDVEVNGSTRTLRVGLQEVAYGNEPVVANDSQGGTVNGMYRPTAVTRDMTTLRLPTVDDTRPLSGPQPLIPQ